MSFYIEKIIVTGSGKTDSIIELSNGVNIIYGPSNTGKTYIVKCIDYMFGSEREPIDISTGYQYIKIIVRTQCGTITMSRKIGENKIEVSSNDNNVPSGKYATKASRTNYDKTINSVWLSLIGINDLHLVISNENYKKQILSWRTFSHNLNVPIPLAIVITIVVGCLLGAANGIIAVKMHIAPIIVTLGTMLVLQGVAYLITGGYPITGMPEAFKVIGQGYVGIIPVPVIIFVLFIIFGAILMNKTYLGRYIYALGGNKEAARLAGINVDKLTVAVYTFCGFCASIAALIMVGRTNAAQPGAGSSYSFDCMTAACLGGVSIAGGEGKISGTVIGVIILGILDNGLVLMSVNTNWQSVIKGLILLAAVAIDCYQVVNKNRKKAAA